MTAALTVNELGQRWACSRDQVLTLIHNGELRGAFDLAIRHGRRHKPRWRIPVEAVEAFESRRAAGPAPRVQRRQREAIPRYV